MTIAERLLDRGLVPDVLLRLQIRRLLAQRLERHQAADPEQSQEQLMAHLRDTDAAPIALATAAANAQHYEVPAEFYAEVLGLHRKYSSGLWAPGVRTLDDAAAAMLTKTCERGRLADGMRVLDLGCGWGALSLWIAHHYPRCEVLGVSNSNTQRKDIEARAAQLSLRNVRIVTADVNTFDPGQRFDRVFSVEMLEHVRNWRRLLARVRSWLENDGRLFVHVFTHARTGYAFETDGAADWMARHFFTGGQMPADSQMLYCQDHFAIDGHWRHAGTHYQRTAEGWLQNMDRARDRLLPLFAATWGKDGRAMWHRWRTFFIACAELWGFRDGREWLVSHYALRPR